MSSFEQDVNTAPHINQDAMNPAIGDLYWNDHGVIVGLNCIVDIFLRENDPGSVG